MVEAHGLVKVFADPERGPVTAADHLSFTAKAGRILGLLGPTGAGKTTLLRLLSTVLRPTSGSATVNGYDLRLHPAAVRRSVGFLSGTTGVYGRLSPTEMMYYFGSLYGLSSATIAARVAEVFTCLEMHGFAHTPCEQLSPGMKQKVNIARAILHDPPVLLLDEPTTGLDLLAARTMHQFIREGSEQGRCVLFSTSFISPAEELCDDLAILHQGRILAHGTLSELRRDAGSDRLEEVFVRLLEKNALPVPKEENGTSCSPRDKGPAEPGKETDGSL